MERPAALTPDTESPPTMHADLLQHASTAQPAAAPASLASESTASSAPPGRRLRAVVFGGGIGMFPPLMERLSQEFEIVARVELHEPRLVSAWYRLVTVRPSRHAWYRAWRYHMEKTPWRFDWYTRASAQALEPLRGRYDVILFFGGMHAPGDFDGTPMFVFTDSCRWLSSRNEHDEISHFRSERDEREWLAREGAVYRNAARVLVGSDFVRDAMVQHYGVDPGRAVTTGFGAGAAFAEPYDKQFDGRSILYIGKGDFEKKGGTLLMKAFERVRREIPEARLHIVGQERLPVAEGVVNHGFVRDRERIVALMRQAHVFALPSLVDRNPISLLEAMAASTPCIASDYGAMPEMVADAGLIAPCGDEAALAHALLRLLRDPQESRAFGQRGRARYEARYNWDRVWEVARREIREALHRA